MNILTTVSEIADALIAGRVVVLPTDTVYGIVAIARDREAVQKIYTYKVRESKPGTIIAGSVGQLVELGINSQDLELAKEYWPGAVSVIVRCDVPDYLDFRNGTLAVRLPKNDFLKQLLNLTGPLMTSSANLTGMPVANNIDEAFLYFGDKVDFYVDGGHLSNRSSSTIIKVTENGLEVIRQGDVEVLPTKKGE